MPKRTPEPADAESLWNSGKVVQTDTRTWYGKGENGYYRYQLHSRYTPDKMDNKPPSRDEVHFNGIFDDVPENVEEAINHG